MKKDERPWLNKGKGGRLSKIEVTVGDMLWESQVYFKHRGVIDRLEVDFLIPRPGKCGLLIEVDGDSYHLNVEQRISRDHFLMSEGWEVVHIWGSEVVTVPEEVRRRIMAALVGVPRIVRPNKKESKKKKKKLYSIHGTRAASSRPTNKRYYR